MTRTQRQQRSRQKIAADNMTPVMKLARALQSGQLKSELRTTQEAIHAATALTKQIEAAELGLTYEKDFLVHIAYLTPDLSMLFTAKFEPGKQAAIQAKLSGQCCYMAGLVFGIRDKDHGGDWAFGARPF